VAPLFDSYVMVDWSAARWPTKPKKDTIWAVRLGPGADGKWGAGPPLHLPTRAKAATWIEETLGKDLAAGRKVLIGFDFPLGYPKGFAARLGLPGPPWRAIWREYAELLPDDENRNDRFVLAEKLNLRVSGGAFPFWGRPHESSYQALDQQRYDLHRHDRERLAERRLVEQRARTSQSTWKLLGIGSVGSQALTGIPRVERLKQRFGTALQVWPFETGLAAPAQGGPPITLVEIYPSLFRAAASLCEVKDAAQVRVAAQHFASLDWTGDLQALFAGDPALTAAERAAVIAEEGWVLGVTGARTNPKTPSPPQWGGEGEESAGWATACRRTSASL